MSFAFGDGASDSILHTAREKELLAFINKSIRELSTVFEQQIVYFKQWSLLEKSTHEQHSKMYASIKSSNSSLLRPLQQRSMQSSANTKSFSHFLDNIIVARLEELSKDWSKNSLKLERELDETLKVLHLRYDQLSKALSTHCNTIKAFIDNKSFAANGEEFVQSEGPDLFLTQERLNGRTKNFVDQKESFSKFLIAAADSCRLLVEECKGELAGLMNEVFKSKSEQLSHQITFFTQSTLATPISAHSRQSFDDYDGDLGVSNNYSPKSNDLTIERFDKDRSCLDESIDTCRPLTPIPLDGMMSTISSQIKEQTGTQPPNLQIVKSGFLMRPATTFGKPIVLWAVLTGSCHFHCFHPPNPKIESANGDSYKVPSSSMRLHRKSINMLNNASQRLWTLNPHLYNQSPEVSLSLSSPSTNLTCKGDAFSICIDSGPGFFGGHRTSKWTFKCFLQEDLVDWCIAIREMIKTGNVHLKAKLQPIDRHLENNVNEGDPVHKETAQEEPENHIKDPVEYMSSLINNVTIKEGFNPHTESPHSAMSIPNDIQNPWDD